MFQLLYAFLIKGKVSLQTIFLYHDRILLLITLVKDMYIFYISRDCRERKNEETCKLKSATESKDTNFYFKTKIFCYILPECKQQLELKAVKKGQ